MAKISASCVCANFSHFYLGIFCLRFSVRSSVHWNSQNSVYYCLVKTLWKREYSVLWPLYNLILFGSYSPKMSSIMRYEFWKKFLRFLIWKELTENVNIKWYKLWKSVYYCLSVTLWIIWYSVLFDSDIKSRKGCSIVCQ